MLTHINNRLLAILLVLTACGSMTQKETYVEPELKQYSFSFLEDLKVYTDCLSYDLCHELDRMTHKLPFKRNKAKIDTLESKFYQTKITFVDNLRHINTPNKGDAILAICVTNDVNIRRIEVSKEHWVKMNDVQKELLIYHELGHCVLNKSHTYDTGVMSVYILDDTEYMLHRKRYLWELFN